LSTDSEEHVVIFTGRLKVKLSDREGRTVGVEEKYVVPRACSFDVETDGDVSYVCYYR
jgi:uncharacterized protein YaiE (UPF0345 family)